jgi:hypothetical protein
MPGQRILYGLDRLPASISAEDARLPGIRLAHAPLRLNSEALPPEAIPDALEGHAARVEAMRAWLAAACGDYARRSREFIDAYLVFVAGCIARHREGLEERLARFEGLYAAEDWFWSAPRPLPRAWLPVPGGAAPVDIAFWDGSHLIAVALGETGRSLPGVETIAVTAADLRTPETLFAARFPGVFAEFWSGETLPVTPFRRPFRLPD